MTVYHLCDNIAAAQTLPAQAENPNKPSNLPSGSNFIDLSNGGALGPTIAPTNQSFTLVVVGNGGATVSATGQVIASNDGVHWQNYGSALSATSGPSPGMANASGSTNFAFYSAFITAITGTGAKASVLMNA